MGESQEEGGKSGDRSVAMSDIPSTRLIYHVFVTLPALLVSRAVRKMMLVARYRLVGSLHPERRKTSPQFVLVLSHFNSTIPHLRMCNARQHQPLSTSPPAIALAFT